MSTFVVLGQGLDDNFHRPFSGTEIDFAVLGRTKHESLFCCLPVIGNLCCGGANRGVVGLGVLGKVESLQVWGRGSWIPLFMCIDTPALRTPWAFFVV